jgi:DNA-binding SARP family transcriptional activator/tetratricopeptide (TPR) repeat protein/DNA-binding XRE family transcriptional regulator
LVEIDHARPDRGPVGVRIRTERDTRRLTQRALAQLSGVRVGTIRDLEQGRTTQPRRATLEAVLRALELPTEDIVDLTAELPPTRSEPAPSPGANPATDSADVRIVVLGGTAVRRGPHSSPITARTQRLLIARLALDAGRSVSREDLFRAVWEREREPDHDHALHTAIGRARKLVAPIPVRRTPLGYMLDATVDQVDASRFTELIGAAQAGETPHERLESFLAAFALWSEFPGDLGRWVDEPLRLWSDYRSAAGSMAPAAREVGRGSAALAPLRNAIALSPFDEALHAELILTLSACGRQAEALTAYQTLRAALVEGMGIEPGRLVQQAHQEVLTEPVITAGHARAVAVPRQAPTPPWTLVGRDGELATLMARHNMSSRLDARPVVTLVSGAAGVGKSALVLEAARRLADVYPDGTLYLDAKGITDPTTPAQAIEMLHRAIASGASSAPDADQAASELRTALAGRRMLVVLDNLRDARILHAITPSVGQSSVLATSRWDLPDVGPDVRLPLDVLSTEGALELLRVVSGRPVTGDLEAARALAGHCGHLPLALAITAARLAARPSLPLAEMVALLDDDDARLEELATGRSSVDASLAASYVLLHEDTRRLLRALSLHRADRIHSDYAAAVLPGSTRRSVHRAVEELVRANLLTEYDDGSLQLHDLTRLYVARELDEAERHAVDQQIDAWYRDTTRAAIDAIYPYLVKLHPRPNANTALAAEDAFAWIAREEAGLVSTVERASGDPERRLLAVELADELRGYFMVRRHIDEWSRVVDAGLSAAEALGDDAQIAAMLLGRAQLSEAIGRDGDTMTHSLRAFRLAAGAGWDEAAAYLAHSIGWTYSLLGHLDDAENWYDEASTRSRDAGSGHVEAMALNALGILRCHQARYAESRHLLERAITANEHHGRHASILVNRGNLARTLRMLGDVARARAHVDGVLSGFRDRGDLRGEASTLDELAQIHLHTGRTGEALAVGRRAVQLAADLGDTRLEGRLGCTLGEAFLAHGDLASAAYWFSYAREIAAPLPYPALDLRARIGSARTAACNGDTAGAQHLARAALTSARLLGHGELEMIATTAVADIARGRAAGTQQRADGSSADRPPRDRGALPVSPGR